jgi:hypothetical protein
MTTSRTKGAYDIHYVFMLRTETLSFVGVTFRSFGNDGRGTPGIVDAIFEDIISS